MIRLVFVALLLAACTPSVPAGATPIPTPAPATAAPTGQPATPAPSQAPTTPDPTAAPCDPVYDDCDPKYTDRPSATQALPSGPVLEMIIDVSEDGPFLVDMDGYSLYTLDTDPPGEATCLDTCADNWPPVGVLAPFQVAVAGEGVPGTLGLFERDDVALTQVTYNDKPLYYFSGDRFPGDTNGDGRGDVWHLALP